ncbi:MAG: hypothetical protein ACHP7E_02885 [Burkholderiales bacterium]
MFTPTGATSTGATNPPPGFGLAAGTAAVVDADEPESPLIDGSVPVNPTLPSAWMGIRPACPGVRVAVYEEAAGDMVRFTVLPVCA